MGKVEFFNGLSPQYLLQPSALTINASSTVLGGPILRNYPPIPPFDRRNRPNVVYPSTSVDNDPILKLFANVDIQVIFDRGKRAANGLRYAQRGEYGKFAVQAANDPKLPQHNHEHGRRVKRHLERFLAIPEIHNIAFPSYLLHAAALFPYLHDSDQLDTEQRNINDHSSLIPKQAHGLAAGLKILAQTAEYAEASGLPLDEARKITGAAAFMMIKHEEPAQLMEALNGTQIMACDTDGAALLEAYEKNLLDLTRLPVNQLIKIMTAKKSQSEGFVSGTNYGLHPLFEMEYAEELATNDLLRSKLRSISLN